MKIIVKIFLILYALLILCGCAGPPAPKKPDIHVFFPPPPEPPRIQFLKSISKDDDFIEIQQGSFADFIVGEKKKKNEYVKKPYGVSIKNGIIYVCDTEKNRIDLLDLKRQQYGHISGSAAWKFKKPINIAVDNESNKFIADAGLNAVVVLDKNNNLAGMYGSKELVRPTGVAVYEDKLFVADAKGSQVAVFNKKSGKLLYKIGKSADESTDEPDNETIRFAAPTNIAVDTEGNIYVSETMGYRIIKLTEDGKHLFTFGAGLGDGFGQFARPRGVAVDHEGRVYSVDAWHSVVQIFNAQGQLLLFFGTIGNQPGNLNLPAQVTIDYDNVPYFKKYVAPGFDLEYLIIVTSQYGNRKINIYGFVHKNGEGDV